MNPIRRIRFGVLRGLVAAGLVVVQGGVHAATEMTPDEMQGIENTLAFRRVFVDGAHALRDRLPDTLRTRVLLSLPPFVYDGKGIWDDDRELPDLVERARGSTDPVVLAKLVERCSVRASPCDPLDMAKRWVEADTQNQRAWLALAGVQHARNDEAAAHATFLRASLASVWRDDGGEIERYLVRLLPKDMSAEDRSASLLTIAAVASASAGALRVGPLMSGCKAPDAMPACHRILAAMFNGADQLITLSVVARLSVRYGVDSAIVAHRYRRYDAVMTGATLVQLPDPDHDEADRLRFNQALERRLVLGEIAYARADLEAAGLTEEAAASRNRVERMAREQRAQDSIDAARRQRAPG